MNAHTPALATQWVQATELTHFLTRILIERGSQWANYHQILPWFYTIIWNYCTQCSGRLRMFEGQAKKKKVKGTSCMHWSISCCKGCHFNIEWISSLLLVKEYILFPFLCICYSLVVSYCLTQCNIWSVSLFQNTVFDLFACQRHIHHYWFTLGIHVIFWV